MEAFIRRYQTPIEIAAVFAALAAYLMRWLSFFMIWPDSSIYLTAAMNLIRHGTLFIYANFPSGSLLPQTEIYADYPPGFPLYLSVFYFFLRDPVRTAFIAQAVALAAFAFLSLVTARALRLTLFWRLCAVFFFVFFISFRVIFFSLLNETLYLSLSLVTFIACLKLMENPKHRGFWALAFAGLIASCTIRWNGMANGIFLLFPIFLHWRGWKRLGLAGLAGISAVAPTVLWFLRNSFYFHKTTPMHDFSRLPAFSQDKILAPVVNLGLRWGFGHFWIFLLIFAFALSPFFFNKKNRPLQLLIAGMLAQLFVIYFMTLAVSVTALDDRYLAPAYMFFAFALIYAGNFYSSGWKLWRLVPVAGALCIMGAIALAVFQPQALRRQFTTQLNLPEEYFLWQKLSPKSYVANSTRYFTDDNYLHQIFAEKPQRLIFSNRLREPEFEGKIRAGNDYFFLLENGSEVQKWAEKNFHLQKPFLAREDIGKFVIYYRE